MIGISAACAWGFAGVASASQSAKVIKAQDDCDAASFNAVIGPGTCVGDGRTTFDTFVGQLLTLGRAPEWEFSREKDKINKGRALAIVNEGGEFHTFSEVAAFGGGCVPELNGLLGLTPVPECEPEAAPGVPLVFTTTGVGPGETITVTGLGKGTHRFECLIHPWMRSKITVK